ncbi:transglutaminase-like domain-containing protein [Roseivirga thermotolerans]|uniref:Transglutaminase n=1 Tax=Roseivirga thermotolerans TaxID=1758176 RepID=A0ABQ3I5K1_9BACT|nr:transglutaminase-like domain-containing protein [Roseivirga thermotolerans]GHE66333.1 transglutaminase [Roseivirga thermotolerans]
MEETNHLNNSELKALVSLLDDDDVEVVQHVENRIMALGTYIIPYLEFEWENSFNPVVQKRIEELVHNLQFELTKEKLYAWKVQGNHDLLEGMWLINTYQYPDLELEQLSKEVEQIYYDAWLEFKTDLHPVDQVKLLNSVMFNKLKFGANTKNFHSPGNSMLNVVLQTRKGNPISLCIIYMLVAQKLKMPIYGVNLPNLFVMTFKQGDVQFYINAFNRGLVFSKKEIDEYITNLRLPPNEKFYEPCTNLDIIARVLRNLMNAHEKLGNNDKVNEVQQMLSIIEASKENQ